MPRLEITCGNSNTQDPHAEIVIAAYFDSRFDLGKALPRLDIQEPSRNNEFTWSHYRQDIGTSKIIPPKNENSDSRITTGYKSGEKIWDTPEFIYLECRKKIWVETNGKRRLKHCHPREKISRADWNEIGRLLMEQEVIVPNPQPKKLPLNLILRMRKKVDENRTKQAREHKRHAHN